MLRLIVIATLVTLLKAMTADAAELNNTPLRRGDGTLPLGIDLDGDAGIGNELEASDGTLPLRLPSDGTLPLRFNGDSMMLTNPGHPATRVTTKVTLNTAVREALRGAAADAVACREQTTDVSKHTAGGTLAVGNVSFKIKAICYNHASTQMEIVAERRVGTTNFEQSFLVGTLESEEPRAFNGRMFVVGQNAAATRYSFSLSCPDSYEDGRP